MNVDKVKLKQLLSNKKPEGGLHSFAGRLTTDLPFDVFYVHNVGDVTLPIRTSVFDQILCCNGTEQTPGDAADPKPCIVDEQQLDSSYCAGFTTKAFSKLAEKYLQKMLQVTLEDITVTLEANIGSLVLLQGNQVYTKIFNEESIPGSFGYMLLKLPVEGDAGQTNVGINYKKTIREYVLDNHPSIFMVSAVPCQKKNWQEFELRQSADSRAAILVFNLLWKNAHELEQFLMPSEFPVFIRETWEINEALSSWIPKTPQTESPLRFFCIPLFNDYSLNDFHLGTLQDIDLFHAKRLISLNYLQVHLAIVSEHEQRLFEIKAKDRPVTQSLASFRLNWISSVETWKDPPIYVVDVFHLIGEPTAKMYSMKEPGNGSSPLCPVQHPVLLIRPKWTALPGQINVSQALADLQNRLPDVLKDVASNRMLLENDLFISDFKLLVSYVCRENNESIPPWDPARLMTMANKLRRFDEGFEVFKMLATKKCSANDELKLFDPLSVLINNIGWERCSAAVFQLLDNSETYVSFVALAKHLLFSRSDSAVIQLTEKIIQKMGNREGNSAPVIEKIVDFYLLLRENNFSGCETIYQLLLSALKKSSLENLWNALECVKGKLTEPSLERFSEILVDLGESVANAELDLITESHFLGILKEYETVNGGDAVIDRLWNSSIIESVTQPNGLRKAPMIHRLILHSSTDQERSDLVKRLSSYPEASQALTEMVHFSLPKDIEETWEQYSSRFVRYFHVVVSAEEYEQLCCPQRIKSMKWWISMLGGALFETAQCLRSQISNENGLFLPVQRELLYCILENLANHLSVPLQNKDAETEDVLQCFLWFGDNRLIEILIENIRNIRAKQFTYFDKFLRALFKLRGLCGEPQDRNDSAQKVALGKLERSYIIDLLAIWLDFLFDEEFNRQHKIKDNYHHIFRAYYYVEKFQPGEENREISKKIDSCSLYVDSKYLKSLMFEIFSFETESSNSTFEISDSCSRLLSSVCCRLSRLEYFASVIDDAIEDESILLLTQCFLRFGGEDSLANLVRTISLTKLDVKHTLLRAVQSERTQDLAKTSRWRTEAFINFVDECVGRFNSYLNAEQNWVIPNATPPHVPDTFSRRVLTFLQRDKESELLISYNNLSKSESFGKSICDHNPEWGLKYEIVTRESNGMICYVSTGNWFRSPPIYECYVTKTRKFDSTDNAQLRKEVLPVLQDMKKNMEALLVNFPPPAKNRRNLKISS